MATFGVASSYKERVATLRDIRPEAALQCVSFVMSETRVPIDMGSLDKYLADELDTEDLIKIEQRLSQDGELRAAVRTLRGVSYSATAGDEDIDVDTDGQWRRVLRRIAPDRADLSSVPQPHRSPLATPRPWSWVGLTMTVLIAGIGIGVATMRIAESRSVLPGMMTYSTAPGQRSSVELSDGTRVLLNVGSQIRIPENFSSGNRTVHLTGEAYFDVTHAADIPFVVEAGGVRTRVLGTTFGVRAYPDAPLVVAVQTGKVAVNNTVVGGREVARLVADDSIVVMNNQPIDAMLGFVEGRLVNRWYDVDIRIADSRLGRLPITATLRGESVAELMAVLTLTFGVEAVRNGRTITVYNPRADI
jgi:transmembrane sensor